VKGYKEITFNFEGTLPVALADILLSLQKTDIPLTSDNTNFSTANTIIIDTGESHASLTYSEPFFAEDAGEIAYLKVSISSGIVTIITTSDFFTAANVGVIQSILSIKLYPPTT